MRLNIKSRLSKFAVRVGAVISCSVILASCFSMSSIQVSAHSSCDISNGGCKCGGCDVSPIGWNQNGGGDEVNKNWSDFTMPGGETISYSGCFATSLAIQMGMSGDFGNFCPQSLFTWGKNNGLWSGNSLNATVVQNTQGYENIFKPLGIDKSIIEGIDDVKFERDEKITDTHEKMYDLAVQLANNGVYVILEVDYDANWTMRHFVPVIGTVKSNNPAGADLVIADPANVDDDTSGARFVYSVDDAASTSSSGLGVARICKSGYNSCYTAKHINSLRVFVSASKFTGKVNATNSASTSEKQAQANFNYVGLTNFMEENYFVDITRLEELALTLPNRVTLADNDLNNVVEVENWANTINNKHEDNVHRYVRASFVFVGILVILYSVLLFVAFQFDRINNFIDIQFLGVLTFHRLGVSPDGEQSNYADKDVSGTKFLTFKDICIVCVAGISLGVLLVSGKIFLLINGLLALIDKLFTKGGA